MACIIQVCCSSDHAVDTVLHRWEALSILCGLRSVDAKALSLCLCFTVLGDTHKGREQTRMVYING